MLRSGVNHIGAGWTTEYRALNLLTIGRGGQQSNFQVGELRGNGLVCSSLGWLSASYQVWEHTQLKGHICGQESRAGDNLGKKLRKY